MISAVLRDERPPEVLFLSLHDDKGERASASETFWVRL